MKINKILLIFASVSLISACSNDDTTTTVSGLDLPANVEVIQDDSATSSNLSAVNMAAYDSDDTDYSNAKAEVWIDAGNWQQPLMMADMLMCIMKNTGANLLPNSTYIAMVDMSQCGNDQGGSQKGKKTRFAEAAIVSTRGSDTSAQYIDAYFSDREDENDDGDTNDEGETMNYITDVVVTEGASTSNPFGVFTFHFNQDNALDGEHSRGSLTISDDSATEVSLNFITEEKGSDEWGDYDFTQWVSGDLKKDGSGGRVKIYSSSDYGGSGEATYKVNFNSTHANIDTSGSTTCYGLDEAEMTSFVYSYNLYNSTTGALIELSAGLEFVYGEDQDIRGWAGQYDAWDDETETTSRAWWIWTEDGSAPTTVYKASDTTVSYSVTWSSGQPTVVGLTLDDPIQFTASFDDSDGTERTDYLNYEGPGQLWGIEWTGDDESGWAPNYNIADGTTLTATDGTEYIVKQLGMWKTLPETEGACGDLSVDAGFEVFEEPTLTAITKTWDDKPTVTGGASVIHGVLQ